MAACCISGVPMFGFPKKISRLGGRSRPTLAALAAWSTTAAIPMLGLVSMAVNNAVQVASKSIVLSVTTKPATFDVSDAAAPAPPDVVTSVRTPATTTACKRLFRMLDLPTG